MIKNGAKLSFEKSVNAPPDLVYRAFTNSSALREWLCNLATTDPRPGGRIYLWWNSGYYTSGEFTSLEENSKISFSWYGRNEPGQTQVSVTIKQVEQGSHINLVHSGIGTSPEWEAVTAEYSKGWENGLENLISVLESGPDLRIVRRPMLGILLNDFNEEIARNLGVPVNQGIRIDNSIAGMGAEIVGLSKDDVIVGLGGKPVTDFSSISTILNDYHAGELINVEFYRGPKKNSVSMTLSGRQIPDIPSSGKEMSEALRKINNQILSELMEFLDNVSEEEAAYKPANNEWCINEIMCHLIHGEVYTHFFIQDLIVGHEAWHDDFGGNIQATIDATLTVYPSKQDLFMELNRSMVETQTLLAHLPDEFLKRKSSVWRLGYSILETPYHFNIHKAQMQTMLETARSS